jgi:ribosome maturation factor RimP
MEGVKQKIEAILESYLQGTDKFLVDIKIAPGNIVQVFIDSDTRITIDDCAEVSRFLGDRLDEETIFPGHYTLEVSSAGMDEPLKKMRQYRKNIGRQVDVLLLNGIRKQGVLLYADDEKIQIEEVKRDKHKTETIQHDIAFIEIKNTKILYKI